MSFSPTVYEKSKVLYPLVRLLSCSGSYVLVSHCASNLHFSAGCWFEHPFVCFFFFLERGRICVSYFVKDSFNLLSILLGHFIVLILKKFKLMIIFSFRGVCECVCIYPRLIWKYIFSFSSRYFNFRFYVNIYDCLFFKCILWVKGRCLIFW